MNWFHSWVPLSADVDSATKPRRLTADEIDGIMVETGVDIRAQLEQIELCPSGIPSLIEQLKQQAPPVPTGGVMQTRLILDYFHGHQRGDITADLERLIDWDESKFLLRLDQMEATIAELERSGLGQANDMISDLDQMGLDHIEDITSELERSGK